ncbi:HET-domain-containing protein, partial [Acephala macrosclerotiorum]
LHNCQSSHTSCASTEKPFFPSRILNVGVEGDTIRLESSDPSCPYVALSYCWGTTASLKTTSQTLEKMFENIPVSSLSNTFLNAVRITRALGFHYLWIDALCIVQDSLSDWTAQVAQMSKVYSHSSLTICIANDTQVSTTPKHKMLDTRPNTGMPESLCSTCDKGYRAFKPLVDDTATTMLLDSPWSKRGWTLQERILSPRILYYSPNSLAWECDGERSSLDRVSQIRDNLKLLGICKNSLPKQEANPSFPLMRSFRKTWREIVREFSKRQLTFATDKLPALAGVAYEMAAMSQQSYHAGLWKGDLINDLLWCRDFPTIPLPRPNYRAPSWSWASIDSPVVWSKSVNLPVEKNAQVLDCETRVLSEFAPFAGVSDGYLHLK